MMLHRLSKLSYLLSLSLFQFCIRSTFSLFSIFVSVSSLPSLIFGFSSFDYFFPFASFRSMNYRSLNYLADSTTRVDRWFAANRFGQLIRPAVSSSTLPVRMVRATARLCGNSAPGSRSRASSSFALVLPPPGCLLLAPGPDLGHVLRGLLGFGLCVLDGKMENRRFSASQPLTPSQMGISPSIP